MTTCTHIQIIAICTSKQKWIWQKCRLRLTLEWIKSNHNSIFVRAQKGHNVSRVDLYGLSFYKVDIFIVIAKNILNWASTEIETRLILQIMKLKRSHSQVIRKEINWLWLHIWIRIHTENPVNSFEKVTVLFTSHSILCAMGHTCQKVSNTFVYKRHCL